MQQPGFAGPPPPMMSQMPPGAPGYGQPPPGAGAGPVPFVIEHQGCSGGGPMLDVFVEVNLDLQPTFNRQQDGTFLLSVPPIRCSLSTQCMPPPPVEPGLAPFKPYEEFGFDFPELAHAVFNPWTGTPPGGSLMAQTRKRGAILEVPGSVGVNAKLKANSPFGSLILEDVQVNQSMGVQQKIGETTLSYQLKVEGMLSVQQGGGNNGSDRLEVDLVFTFLCSLAGMAPAPMMGAHQ